MNGTQQMHRWLLLLLIWKPQAKEEDGSSGESADGHSFEMAELKPALEEMERAGSWSRFCDWVL